MYHYTVGMLTRSTLPEISPLHPNTNYLQIEKNFSEKLVVKILELLWNTPFYYLPFLQQGAAEICSGSIEFYHHSHTLTLR